MRSTLLCLGLLTVLSACSSGSGGSGAGPAGQSNGDASGVARAQARGQFASEKQTTLSEYGGVPEGFELTPAQTCKGAQVYDSRARAGDVFVEEQQHASRSSSSTSTFTAVIQSVDLSRISEKITISNIAMSPALPGLPNQIQAESSCTISNDPEAAMKCDAKYFGWQPPENNEDLFEHCEADYDSGKFAKTSGTVSLGQFKMANGTTVNAQFTHRESTNIDIKCGKGDKKVVVGAGKVINDDVITRDLVTRDASMCTPTTYVVHKTVYQLENGQVLSASLDEVTQAPQR